MIDALYLRQVWAGNEAMLLQLVRDESPAGREPALLPDQQGTVVAARPQRAVRPRRAAQARRRATSTRPTRPRPRSRRGSSRCPTAERARATGFFTVVRRAPDGQFMIVPYSIEYQNELAHAAALLREAADADDRADAQGFLTKRAPSFLSNDYYDSDVAWMELDAPSSRPSGRTRSTRTSCSTTRRRSRRSSPFATKPRRRSCSVLRRAAGHRERTCRSIPAIATRSSARSRRSRVVNEVFSAGDAQPRRADRGVQPAERRARDHARRAPSA